MSKRNWLGLEPVRLTREDVQRILVLAVVCLMCAAVLLEWGSLTTTELVPGEPATRSIKAHRDFAFEDAQETEHRRQTAADQVLPVYIYRADLVGEERANIARAFGAARTTLRGFAPEADTPLEDVVGDLDESQRAEVLLTFRSQLGVPVFDEDLEPLLAAGFPTAAEGLVETLVASGMRGYVVADREVLPKDRGPMTVIELAAEGRTERVVSEYELVSNLEEARQQVAIDAAVEHTGREPWVPSVVKLSRSSVRTNLRFSEEETQNRRNEAADAVEPIRVFYKRGTALISDGEIITERHVHIYDAMQQAGSQSPWLRLIAFVSFLALLLASLYHFGSRYLTGFSTKVRDVASVGSVVVLMVAIARLMVAMSPTVSEFIGYGCAPTAVWFVVPVAGAAMLIRLLMGVGWTVVFSLATSITIGLAMDLEAMYVAFYLLSCVAGAGAVEHTRERLAVLKAGALCALVNAAAVVVIDLVLWFAGGEAGDPSAAALVWGMGFGALGGFLSAFLVLGLMPAFEQIGFVTDYRLMELANLNHPLMRQLMVRAPGSYHHSVIVGSLSEAGCEAIGANALQARVAAYFHDIGKALKPQYFIENQRGEPNKHGTLDATTSAQIIISHVIDGGRMAREYRLPKPIIDNIYMHHGTGLLKYFLMRAREEADDPRTVDEGAFRYPGPKPSTREAGVIMLADKVEAATRTIQDPNEENIRAMITKIINSVMADGQFSECPLTFQELYTITNTFTSVLLGIYHQRIEYADTASISRGTSAGKPVAENANPEAQVITLELPTGSGMAAVSDEEEDPLDENTDYESVDHLPSGD